MSGIETLRHNLQEAFQVATSQDAKLYLVPNYKGTHLYSSKCLLGYIWRFFYWFNFRITKKKIHLTKLQLAVLNTQRLFEEQFHRVNTAATDYSAYLIKKSEGDETDIDERTVDRNRNIITLWNESTETFLTLPEQVSAIWQRIHCPELKNINHSNLGNIRLQLDQLKIFQHLINLEGCARAPIPIQALHKKAINEEELTNQDKRQLDEWIAEIDEKEDLPPELYNGLEVIASMQLPEDDEDETIRTTAKLANLLIQKCRKTPETLRLYEFRRDPEMTEWFRSIKPGTMIPHKSGLLTLETEMSPKLNLMNNRTVRVFTVKDQPDKEIRIICNKSTFPLQRLQEEELTHQGIQPPRFIDIIQGGRIAIKERLYSIKDYLKDYRWNENLLNDPLAKSVIRMVKETIDSEKTLKDLSTTNIKIKIERDGTPSLKALHFMETVDFDFNRLELFIECISGSDLKVFKHLMQNSELSDHRTADAYHVYLKSAFLEDADAKDALERIQSPFFTSTLEIIMESRSVNRLNVYDRAVELRDQMLKMTQELIEETGQQETDIKQRIFHWYRFIGGASIFPYNSIKEKIISTY